MNRFLRELWGCFCAGFVRMWAEQRDFLIVFSWLAAVGLACAYLIGSGPLAAGALALLAVLVAVCLLLGMRTEEVPMNLATIPVTTAAKVVGILVLALALSAGVNVWQLWHAGVSTGLAKGEDQREVLQSRVTVLDRAAAINAAIAKDARADNNEILNDLALIAERGRTERVVYRKAAAAAPLPLTCQPGEARMDAVNAALGPKQEPAR